jgi:gas vesicle protein
MHAAAELDPDVQLILAKEDAMKTKFAGLGLFAAGVGLGVAAGILFAPRAGKHTRTRLLNAANRTRHRLEEVGDELRSEMAEWVDETSEVIAANVAAGKDKAKEKARESGDRVREVLDDVRERFEKGKERVEAYVRSATT